MIEKDDDVKVEVVVRVEGRDRVDIADQGYFWY
jgi:hypothetical protein